MLSLITACPLQSQAAGLINTRSASILKSVATDPRRPFSSTPSSLQYKESSWKITPQTISSLKKQAIANADANYDSLPALTSGFDQLSITKPSSFLKPRLHISALPKLALKLTRPAKETDAYGVNFGVLPRPTSSTSVDALPRAEPEKLSLVDQALKARPTTESTRPATQTRIKRTGFGASNKDPSCHNASSPLLAVSHKKLQKLADLINRYRMTVDQAILQMRFSHKAIAAQVLDLLLKAKQDAIDRGFQANRLVIAEAWVTKGFHTSELQVRARGRHGRISHPSATFCVVLRQSQDASKLALQRRLETRAAQRRLSQRGTISGSPIRLPADGVVPTSVTQRAHWGW